LNLELAMTIFTGLAALVALISAFIARRPFIERRLITVHKLKMYEKAVDKYIAEVGGLHECWKEGITHLFLRWHPKTDEAYPFTQDDLNELALIDREGKLYAGNSIVFLPEHIKIWFSQHYALATDGSGPVVAYMNAEATGNSIRFLGTMKEMLVDAIRALEPNWFQKFSWGIAKRIF
jgi:hypothetical protein